VGEGGVDVTEQAVQALVAEHGGPLLAFAMRHLGDRARAEDVVQETLVRAWERLDRLDVERGSLRPWLFTVARRLIIDAARADAARPRVDAAVLDTVAAADEIDRAMDAWIVSDALQALSPEHREVLVETVWRGRSVREAADVLGVPAGTVKSRTYYALRHLRLLLQERGVTR
jgi:RNA polymerase sigma-70 factor (ECF subfamily)